MTTPFDLEAYGHLIDLERAAEDARAKAAAAILRDFAQAVLRRWPTATTVHLNTWGESSLFYLSSNAFEGEAESVFDALRTYADKGEYAAERLAIVDIDGVAPEEVDYVSEEETLLWRLTRHDLQHLETWITARRPLVSRASRWELDLRAAAQG